MRQITEWLEAIGLAKYQPVFADNEIDWALLTKLTEADLKELGLPLGPRKKLLEAIANLDAAPVAASTGHEAERRQVTVMFSDLVGSTALSARMDPEDLREVISAYQKCVAETVRRFGGFVAKYMGDGVLVYFGYPQAHEDDAERAVRAGLELIAAVSGAEDPALHCKRASASQRAGGRRRSDRIGRGAGARHRRRDAEPCGAPAGHCRAEQVVIAESTRKLLGNLFELEDLGAKDLKGIAGPVRAWAALRPSFGGKPLRGSARERPDRACRAGRRTRTAAAALVEGKDRRRPGGVALRRGRHRQIATDGCAAGTPRHRATHALALFLLAAAHRQRVLSDHRPDGARRRICARRHPASEARQARCAAGADLDLGPGRGTLCRDAVAAERWTLSRARPDPASSAGRRTLEALVSQMRGAVTPTIRC